MSIKKGVVQLQQQSCTENSIVYGPEPLNQMLLPIYEGHQNSSAQTAQSHQKLTWVTLDALCLTWIQSLWQTYMHLILSPLRSYDSQTLLGSRFGNFATTTLTSGDGTTAIQVKSSANWQAYSPSLFSYVGVQEDNNGPITPPCGILDMTLTILLRHPSNSTCCDRFDTNYVCIDNIGPPIPTQQSWSSIHWWVILSKAHWSQSAQFCPPAHSPTQMWYTQESITDAQTFSISKFSGTYLLILPCKHAHQFEMMCHLYFSMHKWFNYKYVHIIKPNLFS